MMPIILKWLCLRKPPSKLVKVREEWNGRESANGMSKETPFSILCTLETSDVEGRRGGGGGSGGGGMMMGGGRGGRGKKKEHKEMQLYIPMYLAATAFGWTMLAAKAVALLTLKALTLSKVAFLVAALVFIKKMMEGTAEK